MKKSTLLTIFRLLEPSEIALLGQLLDTSLFKLPNRHNDVAALFRFLQPLGPSFDGPEVAEKEAVAKRLFGHRTDPDLELRKAMNLLLGVVRKFVLMQQVFQIQPAPEAQLLHDLQSDLGLLRWLASRSETPAPAPTLSKANKVPKSRLLIEQQYRSLRDATADLSAGAGVQFNQRSYSEWLLTGFWNEYEMFEYFSAQRLGVEQEAHLLKALAALDHFYYQIKLSLVVYLQANMLARPTHDAASAPLARQQITASQNMMAQVPDHLEQNLSLQIYQAASEMLLDPNAGEEAFLRMGALMQQPNIQLPKDLLRTLRTTQNAYCAVMYNRTRQPIFLQRRFDLAKIDLDEELQDQSGTTTVTRFTGVISNALLLGKQNHAWVASLLDRFPNGKGILATETPREVYKVNRAHLMLHQGNFREASNELVGYEWYGRIDNPQVLLLAIRVDLKAQYELGRFSDDYTLRTLDAAEKRILRLTGIEEQLKQLTLTFLRMLRQMGLEQSRQQHMYDSRDASAKIAAWRTEIEANPVAEKDWLLTKLSALQPHP
jgi:hypothetical protein